MKFDFSIYPFRDRFPEAMESELEHKDVSPANREAAGQILLDENRTEVVIDFGAETVGYFKFSVCGF